MVATVGGLNVKVGKGGSSWRPAFRLFRVPPSHSFNIIISDHPPSLFTDLTFLVVHCR